VKLLTLRRETEKLSFGSRDRKQVSSFLKSFQIVSDDQAAMPPIQFVKGSPFRRDKAVGP